MASSNSNEFIISIAALIAEAVLYYGKEIFSTNQSLDQTILNLLSPTNSPISVFATLDLIQDLLIGDYLLNPQIILCFPQFIGTDIRLTCKILEVCTLFAQNNGYEAIKKVILPPFFENIQSLPKEIFINLINVSGAVLLASQTNSQTQNTPPDQIDKVLISFIISCMNDSDDSKSIPAMINFNDLQNNIGFIPEAVILLYNNLTVDDGLEIGENQTVQEYISTLQSIAENHPAEMLAFITPQIKQDLTAFQNQTQSTENGVPGWMNLMKRGLRGLNAISKCISNNDIEGIFVSIIELLKTPMRKEAISTLESIALTHPNLYPHVLNAVFPYICINSETPSNGSDEISNLRMQARRSLINLMTSFEDQVDIPFQPFIGYVYQMLQISIQLASQPINKQEELNSSMIFIEVFFNSVESIVTDENQAESNTYVKNILTFAIQCFTDEKDLLYFYSFNIISSAVSKISSSFLAASQADPSLPISIFPIAFVFEIINKIHMNCLRLLNTIGDIDDKFSQKTISMYSSLFSLIKCNNQQMQSYKESILQIIQSILPKLAQFLSSNSIDLLNISWAFASDILRSAPQLFQQFLLKSAVKVVMDLDEEADSNVLGNIALVFYDLFKLNILNVKNFSQGDFEQLIDLFSAPIDSEALSESNDILDIQNISLLLLRLSALTHLPITKQCFVNAVKAVQLLQQEFPDIFAEAQQFIAIITQNNCIEA